MEQEQNQNKKVLVFVGMAGSGKTVCVDYLKSKGLPSTYFGGITLKEVLNRGLEWNEYNERVVREDLRKKEGNGALAIRILKEIEEFFEAKKYTVVVDGLYSWTEYKIFKDVLGDNAIIIAVVAPRSVRHKRLADRPERSYSAKDANSRDFGEIEGIEKGGPIANADYYLANDMTKESLINDLEKLLTRLKINI